MKYYVYSNKGVLFEEAITDMFLQNTEMGELSGIKNGILPGDWRSDFEANYTLTI